MLIIFNGSIIYFIVTGISAQKRHLKAQQARPVTREQRAEMKQRKYRYLYQVRTAHGDVISQVLAPFIRTKYC